MPATRRRFECNHRGFGSYCHRCKQADTLEAKAKTLTGEERDKATLRAERLRASSR